MKRFLQILVTFLFFVLSTHTIANAADIAPPTNVKCSITLTGAQCSASITSTGSSLTNALSKTEWYVSILTPGAAPTDVSSYGPAIFVKSTESGVGIGSGVNIGAGVLIGTGSIDFSYETLLGFTKNDSQGTVLISARTFNSANEATPLFGQRIYLALSEVKSLMTAESNAIADKAAAELKAKQEAESRAAADLMAKQEAAAKVTAIKKITITCVTGKLTKKVTDVKPKCPAGFKVKK